MSHTTASRTDSIDAVKPHDLGHGFSKAYILSLLTVAMLTLIGQAMTTGMIRDHLNVERVLKILDTQRSLCAEIASDAADLRSVANKTDRLRMQSALEVALGRWHETQVALNTRGQNLNLPRESDQEVQAIYAGMLPNYRTIWQAGETILANNRQAKPDAEVEDVQLRNILSGQGKLLNLLNALSERYRVESRRRFGAFQDIGLSMGFVTLLVLGVEFACVFRPEIKSLHRASKRLEELNSDLKHKNEALTAQSDQMERQQAELESLNENLNEIQELYAQAARRMEELFDGVPVACFSLDKEGAISEWNKACEALYGQSSYEVIEQPLARVLHGAMREDEIETLVNEPFEGKVVEGLVWQKHFEDGTSRWIMSSAFPIRNHDEVVIAAICANVDITERTLYAAQLEESMVQLNEYSLALEIQKLELEEANLRLESLATTDGLTGLRNHRSFQERLEHDVSQTRDSGGALSLILMDVDHFKKFNDSYGHPEGDKVLKGVASVLMEYAGEPNTAARYGGEEFVVVLPSVGAEQALAMAEEIRTKIEAACPTGRVVTASMGIAHWTAGMRSRAELIAQADKALYKSKESGRNRVTIASSLWIEELGEVA